MIRTVTFVFPVTLFFAWFIHVLNRAGNGPGLQWNRIPGDANFTAAVTGVPYLAVVLVALLVLYITHVRGQSASSKRPVGAALVRFAAAYVVAVIAGVILAEWYCVADERAFRRETIEHLAGAVQNSVTHDLPLYSRSRWWPGNAQLLVSPLPDKR